MAGPLAEVDYPVLVGFAAGAGIAAGSGVVVSGFLPKAAGPTAAHGRLGGALLCGSVLAVGGLVLVLARTASVLPWAPAVVAAGLAVLGGPLLAETLPLRFRNSRFGLFAALVSCAMAAAALSGLILV